MANRGRVDEPIEALLEEGRKFPPPKDFTKGRALGDTTTLADPNVVAAPKQTYEEEG